MASISDPDPPISDESNEEQFIYSCNNCENHIDSRYHCTVCADFDLCGNCFTKRGHQHKMEKLGFELDDDSGTGDQQKTNSQNSHRLSVQRFLKYLVHACQRVVQHSKSCKQKASGRCPICKQLIALCCFHAKQCQEAKCPVPFCVNIKNRLRQQQLQQRLQQAQILKRRIATMQNRGMSCAVLQPNPGNSNSSSQPSPDAQPHTSPHPPQPSIGMKPSSEPPVGTLQASWDNSGYAPNQRPHQNTQPNPQLGLQQPSQIKRRPNSVPDSIGNSTMGPPQVMPNPGPSIAGMTQRPVQVWQQLIQTMKSPPSAQQEQQAVAILTANPELLAAFIKLRTAQQQQQQQQQQQ